MAYLSGAFGLAMIAQANFLVPLRARELGASFDIIGLIVGAGALAAVFSAIPSGALIDWLGPRRAFALGAGGSGCIALIYPFVTNYWYFLLLQPLLGMVRNLGWMASQGYITSFASADERASMTGRFSLVGNLGQMAGPVAAGFAAGLFGFRWALLVPAAYGIIFMFFALMLSETARSPRALKAGVGLGSAAQLLAVRGVQVVVVLTFARLWMLTVYATFLPIFLVDHGHAPGLVGAIVSASSLVAAIAATTAGFWIRYFSTTTVSVAALMVGIGGLVLVPFTTDMPWVFAGPVLVGVGSGVSWPLLLTSITTAVRDGTQGVAIGLRGMAAQAGMSTAPILIGPVIATAGVALGFVIAGAATGVLLALSVVLSGRPGGDGTRPARAHH